MLLTILLLAVVVALVLVAVAHVARRRKAHVSHFYGAPVW
jgi:hypothetical protein